MTVLELADALERAFREYDGALGKIGGSIASTHDVIQPAERWVSYPHLDELWERMAAAADAYRIARQRGGDA